MTFALVTDCWTWLTHRWRPAFVCHVHTSEADVEVVATLRRYRGEDVTQPYRDNAAGLVAFWQRRTQLALPVEDRDLLVELIARHGQGAAAAAQRSGAPPVPFPQGEVRHG